MSKELTAALDKAWLSLNALTYRTEFDDQLNKALVNIRAAQESDGSTRDAYVRESQKIVGNLQDTVRQDEDCYASVVTAKGALEKVTETRP